MTSPTDGGDVRNPLYPSEFGEYIEANEEVENAHGHPARTNTQTERVEGRYVTNLFDLDVGDNIYVEYGERRDMGGLSYTPNAQEFTGRVRERYGNLFRVTLDISGDDVVIQAQAHDDGRPTIHFTTERKYALKHVIRRTDTTPERNVLVKVTEQFRDNGIKAEFLSVNGSYKVRVDCEDGDDYRAALRWEDVFSSIDAEAVWYTWKDDLTGETGRKGASAVLNHDRVIVNLTASLADE